MALKTTIYLDTSVINFLYASDAPEMQRTTVELFDKFIKTGVYQALISDYVIEEINNTINEKKRQTLLSVVKDYNIPYVESFDVVEIANLAGLYIQNNIIPANKKVDALHIAVTVVNRLDYLVSWNFQHLANEPRTKGNRYQPSKQLFASASDHYALAIDGRGFLIEKRRN